MIQAQDLDFDDMIDTNEGIDLTGTTTIGMTLQVGIFMGSDVRVSTLTRNSEQEIIPERTDLEVCKLHKISTNVVAIISGKQSLVEEFSQKMKAMSCCYYDEHRELPSADYLGDQMVILFEKFLKEKPKKTKDSRFRLILGDKTKSVHSNPIVVLSFLRGEISKETDDCFVEGSGGKFAAKILAKRFDKMEFDDAVSLMEKALLYACTQDACTGDKFLVCFGSALTDWDVVSDYTDKDLEMKYDSMDLLLC